MSLRKLLGKVVLLVGLNIAAYNGANIRQEDIEQILNMANKTVIVQTQKKDREPPEE